jgi:hypothetical protein
MTYALRGFLSICAARGSVFEYPKAGPQFTSEEEALADSHPFGGHCNCEITTQIRKFTDRLRRGFSDQKSGCAACAEVVSPNLIVELASRDIAQI